MYTILCFGDSNTYGYDPHTGFRYDYELRWTSILQNELKDKALVIPEGLNGRTTTFEDEIRPGRNGHTYLEPCLHSHGPVDLVILMLGTNDLKVRFQLTPKDIGKGIERCIKTILSVTPQKRRDGKPAEILLVSPIHIGDDIADCVDGEEMGFERGVKYSKQLASIYQQWAKEYGIHFMNAASYAEPSHLDACHLEPEGHKALGQSFIEKCLEIMSAGSSKQMEE